MISTWAVILVAMMIATAQSGGQNPSAMMSAWASDPIFVVTLMAVGVAWAIIGGFVAGKVAGREPVRHAIWAGVASTVMGLLWVELQNGGAGITWLTVFGALITAPCAALGGYFARPRR